MPFANPLLAQPLREDLAKLEQILGLLDVERDATVRADLAAELVNECALIEDTKERSLYPMLRSDGFETEAAELLRGTEVVRDAMKPVFLAVHHTVPIDVHQSDPTGFESALSALCREIRAQREREDIVLARVTQRLSRAENAQVAEVVEAKRRTAVARPRTTRNPLRRLLSRAVTKVEREFPDTSHQYHPGRDKLA